MRNRAESAVHDVAVFVGCRRSDCFFVKTVYPVGAAIIDHVDH